MTTVNLKKIGGLVRATITGGQGDKTIYQGVSSKNIRFIPGEDGKMMVSLGYDSFELDSVTDIQVDGVAITDIDDFESKIATVFPDAGSAGGGGVLYDDLGNSGTTKILGKDALGNNHYYNPSSINNLILCNWEIPDGVTYENGILTFEGTATANVAGAIRPLKANKFYKLKPVTTGTGGIIVQIADGTIILHIAAGDNTELIVNTSDVVDADISIGADSDGFTGTVDSIELVEVLSLQNVLEAEVPLQKDVNIDTGGHDFKINGAPISTVVIEGQDGTDATEPNSAITINIAGTIYTINAAKNSSS